MVARDNAGSVIGEELLAMSGQMLGWWKRVRDERLASGVRVCRRSSLPRRWKHFTHFLRRLMLADVVFQDSQSLGHGGIVVMPPQ
jgi:hypothetical protein